MAETVRQYNDLLELFEQNFNQNISHQDLRDFLASAMLKYSEQDTKTSNYTATNNDVVLILQGLNGSVDLTLPDCELHSGKIYFIKCLSRANTVRILTTSSQYIDGATSITFQNNYDAYIIVSDGSRWRVLAKNKILQATDFESAAYGTPVKTTPLVASAAGDAATLARSNHTHQSPGGIASSASSLSNSTTETQILGATIPAGLASAGMTLGFNVEGFLSTKASSPGTLTLRIRLGASTLTGTILATKAISVTAGLSSAEFKFSGSIQFRTVGATGSVRGNFMILSHWGTAEAFADYWDHLTATATNFNTTGALVAEVTAQFDTADVGNVLTWNLACATIEKM